MALEIHVLAQPGPLPTLRWRWDAETDILTGTIDPPVTGAGYTGTVELNDDDGSIAVLDISAGVLCGIDIVVWPDITTLAGLAAPVEARRGQVLVPSRTAKRGVAALEFDTTLTVSADPDETTFHLRIGTRRPVEAIRVADHFLVEVDSAQRLAGFWLEHVPQPPGLE
jgi:hypothetical protein